MIEPTKESDLRRLLNLPEKSADVSDTTSDGPHLFADLRLEIPCKHQVKDARQTASAIEALGRLPGQDESFHIMLAGRHPLWAFVPAAITMAGRIRELWIATLGFSKRNVRAISVFVDNGDIANLYLLCSHYFKGTSKAEYGFAVKEFGKRPNIRFLSIRTHAKMLLMSFEDGRTLTIESSANLRSCNNIEQCTATGNQDVFDFHRAWISDLFRKGQP